MWQRFSLQSIAKPRMLNDATFSPTRTREKHQFNEVKVPKENYTTTTGWLSHVTNEAT